MANLIHSDHPLNIPEESLELVKTKHLDEAAKPPDHDIACVDFVYFMVTQPKRFEIRTEYLNGDGSWNQVGRHMRFQPSLVALAEEFLRYAFALRAAEAIPPVSGVLYRRLV